ncbi:uncharacterized protein LOC100677888 [Nasonia vitripennis]|uniref:FAST kinase-like protein subdomain 2 domain-containing protein n=1 Tax=Nasonia vitripennis TaxID=7425 RepID=A0A7M7IZY0_NASVI|nr:uncharacterized protein LOC100677888 [Nasonia vitripennis]XP_016837975.1 uncharacterized protein LOC100677888 [Nasonia vitripennis]XP_031780115.1 uncharacterized protein LOC100677888 [Nasonia vitripennis]
MDFMVKRLITLSVTIRNLAFSQAQRVNISRFCNTSQLHKDEVNRCNLKAQKEDLMLKTLRQGLSPSNLLNYIDSNKDQIRREHVIAALSSLHYFYRDKCQITTNLDEQIDFTKLCNCLQPQIKQLTPNEVIEALNILQLLNVPSSNIFVMTLLQHIEEYMKDLSFQDMYKLSTVLVQFSPTNFIKSIESSIKSQCFAKISQLDKSDISTLIYALCFASKNVQDKAILNFLSDAVENYKEKIELKDALHILKSLCYTNDLPYKFTSIIERVQKIIIENIDELNPNQILQIIKDVSFKISTNHDEFYNETFIDELVQKVIYENWDFTQGSDILSCLNFIRHVQIDLLDYLSAKCYEDPNVFNEESNVIQPLVTGLALADYKPVFWDVMKQPILSQEISKMEHLKLCYFALHLACLECFEPMLLKEAFSTKHIISEEHQQIILRLYQIIKILCPSYGGPWPSKDLLDLFKNSQLNKDYPLLPALEQAIGGNVYIKTNVRTTMEHYIDHVVILNRSGYPIAINSYGSIKTKCHNNGITYLEDLTIPPDSQIYLILYAQPEWYARNTQRMLGPYSLFIRTLESMSYTVIPVNGKMWEKMPENEKTLYIMQAIKLKFEDDTISTTS